MTIALDQEVAAARRRFDDACQSLRPELHRFCTRMLGNPCDGEDVVQDTLVLAFYRCSELRDPGALRAWLFRIAHNKCVDRLRGQRRVEDLSVLDDETEDRPAMADALDDKRRLERAVTAVVTRLPVKQRACLILKDVLAWSLEDTAEITGSTVGAVKAALHRARDTLDRADTAAVRRSSIAPGERALVERYLDAFNRRDWSSVMALLSDEAHLEVVRVAEGPIRDACYFDNYARFQLPWKLALARVDGEEAIVQFRELDGRWVPHAIVQLRIEDGRIAAIRDFTHVDYLLADCAVEPGP